MTPEFWSVPKCWPGETVAVLGCGASLNSKQVKLLKGKCRIVATNRAYELAPDADWLFGADAGRFWLRCSKAVEFAGAKIVIWPPDNRAGAREYVPRLVDAGVKLIKHCSPFQYPGISDDPGVVYGSSSVHHVLSVIHHTGVKRVLLLGVDHRSGHFHEDYPGEPSEMADYRPLIAAFGEMALPLAKAGVEVVNCSPGSAVKCWPQIDIAHAVAQANPVL